MTLVKVGDYVKTYSNHYGQVIKTYCVTGVSGLYVHIKEASGSIYRCHISNIWQVYTGRPQNGTY